MLALEQIQYEYKTIDPELTVEEQRYASLVRFYCTMYPFLCSINKYKRWYEIKQVRYHQWRKSQPLMRYKQKIKQWKRKTDKKIWIFKLFWRL